MAESICADYSEKSDTESSSDCDSEPESKQYTLRGIYNYSINDIMHTFIMQFFFVYTCIDLLESDFLIPDFTGNAVDLSNPIGIGGTRKLRWCQAALDILNDSKKRTPDE